MERFDAVVVGAGPAGSVAAYHLAAGGASVLLLDKARFPRDKPCGGGLTVRALRELPFSVDPVVEDRVDCFEIRFRYGRSFTRKSNRPLAVMTQRRRLDDFLARRAADAGADFRDGVKVADLAECDHGVRLTVDGEPVGAKALIGADGVNGIVARAFGIDMQHRFGVALEGNLAYGAGPTPARYAGRMVLELGSIPGGYGWVFPKGDHVNFGVGGWDREGPLLRAHLRDLCDAHGVDQNALTDVRGYRLPMRRPDGPLARARVTLIGDAAGLVDPVSGDGMYEAFVSARLAAKQILRLLAGETETLEPYAQEVIRAVGPNAAAGWSAKTALERFPRVVFGIVALPPFWAMLERLVRGEIGHPSEAPGLAGAPIRLVKALAKRAGDPGAAYRAALSA
jgi:geranylgeranyl reductase family protein